MSPAKAIKDQTKRIREMESLRLKTERLSIMIVEAQMIVDRLVEKQIAVKAELKLQELLLANARRAEARATEVKS